jgi:hypothetical protein
MSDLGKRAPALTRKRLGSSVGLAPIARPENETRPEVAAAEVTPPAEPPATDAPAPAAASRPAGRPSQVRPSTGTGTASVGITLRLGEGLRRRLLAYKDAEGLSFPTVVLLAVQSSYARLPQLLAARSMQITVDEGPNLFGLPAQVTRRSSTATEPKQALPIKVSAERRDVLTQIVQDVGAPSLNELIVTALEDFLPQNV